MCLLVGPETMFIRKRSIVANRAGHYINEDGKCPCFYGRTLHSIGWEVLLLIGLDSLVIMKGSVLTTRA